MTDPGSFDETGEQDPVSPSQAPTREIPRVQTPSEPRNRQDVSPSQPWQHQNPASTQQWTANQQWPNPQTWSGQQDPQGQNQEAHDSRLPSEWFRDPEAERTRAMATVPQNPVFTPPPPPSSPAKPSPQPLPPQESSRHLSVLIGLVIGLLVLAILGAVLLFAGGTKGRSSGQPAPVVTPSASSQPEQSASQEPQEGVTSIDSTPSFLQSTPATEASSAPSTPKFTQSRTRQVADTLPAGDEICSSTVGAVGTTSCLFALEVADAIPSDAQGEYEVNAHSPVTGKDYTMTCKTEETYTTCTGGVAAVVHILR
ncbi:hypothetical protein O6R08_01145 [Cutibacterium equinum]|uniref:Uncharacterized protein n=1 Tax=Cutibacterium equinum TaxID=3016342 RepID=A0ABY7R0P8_9ACTN|nr:hypothetical protein [Cutibacterium equinum]WCC80193.1 hypothetical protein O6R08_01145 [Cutibacterium equinum]